MAYNEGEGWQELEVLSASFFLSEGFVFWYVLCVLVSCWPPVYTGKPWGSVLVCQCKHTMREHYSVQCSTTCLGLIGTARESLVSMCEILLFCFAICRENIPRFIANNWIRAQIHSGNITPTRRLLHCIFLPCQEEHHPEWWRDVFRVWDGPRTAADFCLVWQGSITSGLLRHWYKFFI